LNASECAVSIVTFLKLFVENLNSASIFTDLLKAMYNIRAPGRPLAYSINVVVLPDPATALINIFPVELKIPSCSFVHFINGEDIGFFK
jgi:hypothetical protein